MKNSLLFYFLLLPFIGFCQADYEHVFIKEEYSTIKAITTLNQKVIAVGSVDDGNWAKVWQLDEAGNLAWESMPLGGNSQFKNILLTENKDIILSGFSILACDLINPLSGFAVVKIDTLGNTIFNTQLPYGEHTDAISAKKNPLLILNDSTLWMGGLEKIFHLNLSTGDSITSIDYNVNQFVAFLQSNNEIQALTQRKLLKLTETGEVQSELIFHEDLTDLKKSGDTLIIAGTNQIFTVFNGIVDSSAFNQLDKIQGIVQDVDNNWLIWGIDDNTQQPTVIKFNSNLSILENYNFGDSKKGVTHIVSTEETYFIAGIDIYEETSPYRGHFISRKPNLTTEQFPAYHDIGITSLTLETDIEIISMDTVDPITPIILYELSEARLDYSMTIENFGDTPVDIFGYASSFNSGIFCSLGRFIRINEGVLMPGEQITLSAPLFIDPYRTSLEINYCFFTFAPNETFDQVFENNGLCNNHVITSDNEQPFIKKQISVFPNPANDILHVLVQNDLIQNWELTDISGKKILVQKDINAMKTEIQRGDLPAGVYFLKIETTEGQKVEKVIFE